MPWQFAKLFLLKNLMVKDMSLESKNLDYNQKLIRSFGRTKSRKLSNHKNSLLTGVMNIGRRPTVSDKAENRIEIHIFDFNEDLYGQQLEVEVHKKVRDEKKFDSIEQLSQQIEKDTLFARQYFSYKFN